MHRLLGIGLGLGFLVLTDAAEAKPLLGMAGHVKLLDGVVPGDTRVELGLDLNRDGELNSFERVRGRVSARGSYNLEYTPDPTAVDFEFVKFVADLLADYNARGFDAVLDDGPLPIVLRVEREGYSTIIKRFTTFSDAPKIDVTLAPLIDIHCEQSGCMTRDGSVRVSGFPGGTGIARAYAQAYDPGADGPLFPGVFADDDDNLLISSGFTEINMHDEDGNKVTQLSSPVSVRFEARRTSWPSLRDLTKDSERIEVPMYSFNEDSAEWVSEAAGVLETADGTALDEAEFDSIRDGSYPDPVFISFKTSHFSTFNCDAPVTRRACVKGRILSFGKAVAGVQVQVQGVNYTGSAGAMVTGSDGAFALDLMKSEEADEDVDNNGERGQTFEANVTASGAIGVYVGQAFATPRARGTVGGYAETCAPRDCDCEDLGDLDAEFEPARACEVTVSATFSGDHSFGSGGPLSEGDAVALAKITGSLSGASAPRIDPTACADTPCDSAQADADGTATFIVPVVGAAPRVEVRASYSVKDADDTHYYDGSVIIDGCAKGVARLDSAIELELNHSSLAPLSDFIAALGAGPAVPGNGGNDPIDDITSAPGKIADQASPPSCGCRTAPTTFNGEAWLAFLALFVARLRRRGQ